MKQINFTLYYFGIGILFIILENLQSFFPALVVKALIIPALMLYYHSIARKKYTLFHRLMMAGLFFSWLGDVLLQFSNDAISFYFEPSSYFLMGLGSFLVTQVLYAIAFSIPKGQNRIFNKRLYFLVLIVIYGGLLIWFLYNKLGDYRIPVIVYAVVILTMLASAVNRYGKVNGMSYMLVAFGALFFVISDSMIAVNRFYEKFDFARILIMGTYVIAQYLIATGSLKQDFGGEEKDK